MKFAFVSHVLPPSLSGQAMMIYRLLHGLDPGAYCLISRYNYDPAIRQDNYTCRLPGKYHHLPDEFELTRGWRFGLGRVRRFLNVILGIVSRARHIARLIRLERCTAVIAATGDLIDLPAAFLASRWAGVHFYPYIFDYYSYQWIDRMPHFFARHLEPILMRGAKGVIVPNEFLQDALRRRYRVESTLIRNSCDLSDYEGDLDETSGRGRDGISIVYTGAVYDAHYDAFRNLVTAVQRDGNSAVRLHLYTPRSAAFLAQRGIRGPVVCHEFQPLSAMPGIQRRADLLFLPLAFNSPYPEVIRTSATTKLGEYLAARRPILVHAPANSFVSWYFRSHACGVVVDEGDPAKLAEAIKLLLTDEALQQKLSQNAWERARNDFNTPIARAEFAELMKLDSGAYSRGGRE